MRVSCKWFCPLTAEYVHIIILLLQSESDDGRLLRASLGSVDFITSRCKSRYDSERIKDAVNTSLYGSEFVRAALSVNEKARFHL